LSPAERTAREACAKRSVSALGKAVDIGFHDGVRFFQFNDLDVVRREPGFREIVTRFKNGSHPS
jgi:hypothetical protein